MGRRLDGQSAGGLHRAAPRPRAADRRLSRVPRRAGCRHHRAARGPAAAGAAGDDGGSAGNADIRRNDGRNDGRNERPDGRQPHPDQAAGACRADRAGGGCAGRSAGPGRGARPRRACQDRWQPVLYLPAAAHADRRRGAGLRRCGFAVAVERGRPGAPALYRQRDRPDDPALCAAADRRHAAAAATGVRRHTLRRGAAGAHCRHLSAADRPAAAALCRRGLAGSAARGLCVPARSRAGVGVLDDRAGPAAGDARAHRGKHDRALAG